MRNSENEDIFRWLLIKSATVEQFNFNGLIVNINTEIEKLFGSNVLLLQQKESDYDHFLIVYYKDDAFLILRNKNIDNNFLDKWLRNNKDKFKDEFPDYKNAKCGL